MLSYGDRYTQMDKLRDHIKVVGIRWEVTFTLMGQINCYLRTLRFLEKPKHALKPIRKPLEVCGMVFGH